MPYKTFCWLKVTSAFTIKNLFCKGSLLALNVNPHCLVFEWEVLDRGLRVGRQQLRGVAALVRHSAQQQPAPAWPGPAGVRCPGLQEPVGGEPAAVCTGGEFSDLIHSDFLHSLLVDQSAFY